MYLWVDGQSIWTCHCWQHKICAFQSLAEAYDLKLFIAQFISNIVFKNNMLEGLSDIYPCLKLGIQSFHVMKAHEVNLSKVLVSGQDVPLLIKCFMVISKTL